MAMRWHGLPVDPRLGRMLIEARKEKCLPEVLPIVAALRIKRSPRRPAEKTREADAAHARWKDGDSDFIGLLRMWNDLMKFRDNRGRWKGNQLRKFCATAFLSARRVMEWANVCDELANLLEREWKIGLGEIGNDLSGPAAYATSTKRCSPACHGSSVCGIVIRNPTAGRTGILRDFSRLRVVRPAKTT